MKELVEVIAKALVDQPEEVAVTETENEKSIVLELHVAQTDMGKVIGKLNLIFTIVFHLLALVQYLLHPAMLRLQAHYGILCKNRSFFHNISL